MALLGSLTHTYFLWEEGNSFAEVDKQRLYYRRFLQSSEEEVEQEGKDGHKAASVEKMSEAKRIGCPEEEGAYFFMQRISCYTKNHVT